MPRNSYATRRSCASACSALPRRRQRRAHASEQLAAGALSGRPASDPLPTSSASPTLRRTGLLDSPPEPVYDRITELAARVLEAPVALVSLVDEDRQFFKSCVGLGEPWNTTRETPLSHSFCQYTLDSASRSLIDDARIHPLVRENLAIRDLDVIAYAGVPLITSAGHALGTLCVIDHQPRTWTTEHPDALRILAASVVSEIERALNH